MRVDVIVRSKNSGWVIHQALAGLFAQDHREFDLLVVDSGSTDDTLQIVGEFPARLVQISAERYFPGHVLNMALEETFAEVVVFQNSDVVPLGPSALRELLAPFADRDVQATFARQVVRPEAHTWVRRDYALSFPERGDPPPWMYYSLPFAAIRRSAWREHPFYTDAWGSEDTEWGHWARTHGRRVRYVPESVVMHSHNYTLRQLYGRRFIEGEADAFIFRGRHGAGGMCARLVSSVARDLVQHARARDVVGLALAPARRAVSHWAYHQGHALGESRIARGDRDATRGQRVVLERHDAATPHTRATSS